MKKEKYTCPKCSHYGKGRPVSTIINGCGRKIKLCCEKCGEIIYIVDDIKQTLDTPKHAKTRLFD